MAVAGNVSPRTRPRLWLLALLLAVLVLAAGGAAILYLDLGGSENAVGRQQGPVATAVVAGGVALEVEAERGTVGVAELLEMRVTVEAPPGSLVSIPDLEGVFEAFAVESRDPIGPVTIGGERQRWLRDYVLTPAAPGTTVIPPVTVIVQQAVDDGEIATRRIQSEPLPIEVTTVLTGDADVTKPRGIIPPLAMPEPERRPVWPWLAAGAAALALAVAFLRRRSHQPVEGVPETTGDDDRLEALRSLAVPETAEDIPAFYVRLAEIVRDCTFSRFGIPAGSLTTDETVRTMRNRDNARLHAERLGRVLGDCDMVKFARRRPSREATERVRSEALAYLEDTVGPGSERR